MQQLLGHLPIIKALIILINKAVRLEIKLKDLPLHPLQHNLYLIPRTRLLNKKVQLDEPQPLIQPQKLLNHPIDILQILRLDVTAAHIITELAHEIVLFSVVGDQ